MHVNIEYYECVRAYASFPLASRSRGVVFILINAPFSVDFIAITRSLWHSVRQSLDMWHGGCTSLNPLEVNSRTTYILNPPYKKSTDDCSSVELMEGNSDDKFEYDPFRLWI